MDFEVSISVIMAQYNTDIPMLKEAVESILNQTFRDFEFIIVDDGSTDDSGSYLRSITDERVKIIWSPQNNGITKSLNIGLRASKGKYIARMDADDISLPTRFEKEFAFMEAHPDVIACGARIGILDNASKKVSETRITGKQGDMEYYRVRMLFINPGPVHPTAFFRHEKMIENGITYDEMLRYAQDYGMWETLSHYGRIVTLDDVLLYHRMHEKQITTARRAVQMQCDKMTQRKILTALLGQVTDEELDLHYSHSTGYFMDVIITPEVSAWYDRLIRANRSKHIYNQRKLKKYILKIKKNLIRLTIIHENSTIEKFKIVFHYLPFFPAIRACLGVVRHRL